MFSAPSIVVGVLGIMLGVGPIVALSTSFGSISFAIIGTALSAVLYMTYFSYTLDKRQSKISNNC